MKPKASSKKDLKDLAFLGFVLKRFKRFGFLFIFFRKHQKLFDFRSRHNVFYPYELVGFDIK